MPAAAPAKPPNPAGAEIERWLRENPDGPLVVAGGYVSVRGLCWLAQRTRDRPVTLVVGDTREFRFAAGTPGYRTHAVEFLNRPDVAVRNWYRRSAEGKWFHIAHLKVWMTESPTGRPGSVLLGSANLSYGGLAENWEMMARVSEADETRVREEMRRLLAAAEDRKSQVIGHVSAASATAAAPAGRDFRGRDFRTPAPVAAGGLRRLPAHPRKHKRARLVVGALVVVFFVAVVASCLGRLGQADEPAPTPAAGAGAPVAAAESAATVPAVPAATVPAAAVPAARSFDDVAVDALAQAVGVVESWYAAGGGHDGPTAEELTAGGLFVSDADGRRVPVQVRQYVTVAPDGSRSGGGSSSSPLLVHVSRAFDYQIAGGQRWLTDVYGFAVWSPQGCIHAAHDPLYGTWWGRTVVTESRQCSARTAAESYNRRPGVGGVRDVILAAEKADWRRWSRP